MITFTLFAKECEKFQESKFKLEFLGDHPVREREREREVHEFAERKPKLFSNCSEINFLSPGNSMVHFDLRIVT